jgi:hypothetical protein
MAEIDTAPAVGGTPARPAPPAPPPGLQTQEQHSGTGSSGGATEQAKQTAQRAADQGRERARQQVDQRSTQAGERMQSTGSDLRSVGEELRKQGKEGPAKLADNAAQRVERVGGYLKESDADRILNDVEDFGRRQPLALLAGGMVVGLALARFMKASSGRRYSERQRAIAIPQPVSPDNGMHSQRFEPHTGA